MHRFNRLLLTGAAGGLGRELRRTLKPFAQILRLSDIAPLGAAASGEELVACDLADKAQVHELLAGVDAIVHMGGISTEQPYETILGPNIVGLLKQSTGGYAGGMLALAGGLVGSVIILLVLGRVMAARESRMAGAPASIATSPE